MRIVRINCRAILVALQNQTKIHYAMPVRVMNTDAANYHNQWTELQKLHRKNKDLTGSAEFLSGMKKEDRLKPVLTIVAYFGREPWNGPRTLKDLLNLSGLDPAIRKIMVENQKEFHTLDKDAYDLIGVMSNTKEFDSLKPTVLKKGGHYDMCKAIDDMIQDGREEGRKAGIEIGRKSGIQAGRNTLNILFQKLIQDNRQDELLQSIHDPGLQLKLLKEYSLEI